MVHSVCANNHVNATNDTEGLAFMALLGDYRGSDLLLRNWRSAPLSLAHRMPGPIHIVEAPSLAV